MASADSLSAARDAQRQGKYEEALQQYAAALGADPRSRAAERGIETVLRERLPLWILESHLALLPMDRVQVLSRAEEPREIVILTTQPHAAPPPARDPGKTHLAYGRCAGAYELREGKYELAVVARWAAGVEDTTAHRALRLFALCRLAAAKMGIERVYYETSKADTNYRGRSVLWLSASGAPGGETIGRSVWLTGMGEGLGAEDLVRIVAHEAGHALIPPIRGCAEPEPTAEGCLGEILFPRCLLELGIPILGEPEPDAELRAAIRGKGDRLEAAYRAHGGEGDPGGDVEGVRILVGGFLVLLDRGGPGAVGGPLARRGLDRSDLWSRLTAALERAPGRPGSGEESPSPGGR